MTAETARAYHETTKHSPLSIERVRWSLDWDNKPFPFKIYEGLPRVSLLRELPRLGVAALNAIATIAPKEPGVAPDAAGLARLLSLGAGVIRQAVYPDGTELHFRTYACAGALYPVELYVVAGPLDGLGAGVYHFDPKEKVLTVLREGDHRPALARACAGESSVQHAPLALVLAGIPWRTAWKYTERGYRHLFWDSGMILANVLALAASAHHSARVVLGFVDEEVDQLLGLDGRSEFTLCVVPIGAGVPVSAAGEPASPIRHRVRPLSRHEVDFPLIAEIHDAGRLRSSDEVQRWRSAVDAPVARAGGASPAPSAGDSLEDVIRRRGSARAFGRRPIPIDVLADILDRSTRGVPMDIAVSGQREIGTYLTAHAIDGLDSGAYRYVDGEFQVLRQGNFRRQAGHLCLDQPLGAQAAATHFLMADLERVLDIRGDRGYRAIELEAGIVSGKMHLAAYAHKIGATGLTFYDDAVSEFLSPEAANASCMLVTALGESLRRLS